MTHLFCNYKDREVTHLAIAVAFQDISLPALPKKLPHKSYTFFLLAVKYVFIPKPHGPSGLAEPHSFSPGKPVR